MTYLEKYLEEHKCSEKEFREAQEDYDGFCPSDIGMDGCLNPEMDCLECWNRNIIN